MKSGVNYRWEDASLVPAGGWQYIQPETKTKIQDWILDQATARVADHRAANGLPPGDPRQDVINFTCAAQAPGRCLPEIRMTEDDVRLLQNTGIKKDFTLDDVFRFLSATAAALGSKGLVDEDTANERAATCAVCPLNVGLSGCYGCNNLASKVYDIIGAKETRNNQALMNCGVCGCNLRAKVWLPQDVAEKASEGYTFPTWCWLNAELPQS